MLASTQDSQYFARMASALGDKSHLLSWLEGPSVLDLGAGGGELAHAMRAPGRTVYALDGSYTAISRMRDRYGDDLTYLQCLAHEVSSAVPAGTFSTVVASSIFHEVYSYGTPETGPYSLPALSLTLDALHSALRPGGLLLLRDGIAPDEWDRPVQVHLTPDGMEFYYRYMREAPFASWEGEGVRTVRLNPASPTMLEGPLGSAMEFLYTYTWGWQSSAREMKELYGLFTEADYRSFLAAHGFEVEDSGQYLQPGYYHHLKDRARLTYPDGTPCAFPASNCVFRARRV